MEKPSGNHQLAIVVMRIEATKKQIEHLAWLGDGVAVVAQLVGKTLELGAVLIHGHVA